MDFKAKFIVSVGHPHQELDYAVQDRKKSLDTKDVPKNQKELKQILD